jgi:hypothetical protein
MYFPLIKLNDLLLLTYIGFNNYHNSFLSLWDLTNHNIQRIKSFLSPVVVDRFHIVREELLIDQSILDLSPLHPDPGNVLAFLRSKNSSSKSRQKHTSEGRAPDYQCQR